MGAQKNCDGDQFDKSLLDWSEFPLKSSPQYIPTSPQIRKETSGLNCHL